MLMLADDRNMINSSRYLPCFVDPFRFVLKTEVYYSSSVSFIPRLQSEKKFSINSASSELLTSEKAWFLNKAKDKRS